MDRITYDKIASDFLIQAFIEEKVKHSNFKTNMSIMVREFCDDLNSTIAAQYIQELITTTPKFSDKKEHYPDSFWSTQMGKQSVRDGFHQLMEQYFEQFQNPFEYLALFPREKNSQEYQNDKKAFEQKSEEIAKTLKRTDEHDLGIKRTKEEKEQDKGSSSPIFATDIFDYIVGVSTQGEQFDATYFNRFIDEMRGRNKNYKSLADRGHQMGQIACAFNNVVHVFFEKMGIESYSLDLGQTNEEQIDNLGKNFLSFLNGKEFKSNLIDKVKEKRAQSNQSQDNQRTLKA
jgi:hypothetical protein